MKPSDWYSHVDKTMHVRFFDARGRHCDHQFRTQAVRKAEVEEYLKKFEFAVVIQGKPGHNTWKRKVRIADRTLIQMMHEAALAEFRKELQRREDQRNKGKRRIQLYETVPF